MGGEAWEVDEDGVATKAMESGRRVSGTYGSGGGRGGEGGEKEMAVVGCCEEVLTR